MLISPWHLTANPAATQVAAGSGLQDYSGNVCDSAGNISRPQWSFQPERDENGKGRKRQKMADGTKGVPIFFCSVRTLGWLAKSIWDPTFSCGCRPHLQGISEP
jgi:hypothetical protein